MIAVVDQRMSSSMKQRLSREGFSVIPLPPFSLLAKPVASHPDMLIFPFEDKLFVHRSYYEDAGDAIDKIRSASGRALTLIDTEISPEYPKDVPLNLFCIGKNLIGKMDVVPQAILDYAQEKGYRMITTNQGYAKCSSVLLGERAVITADPSIQSCVKALGTDVLQISEGAVSLPPYPYGFLGGASGYTKDTVYFCGSIDKHPDAKRILAFCQKHECRVVSLSTDPLIDLGSILFL